MVIVGFNVAWLHENLQVKSLLMQNCRTHFVKLLKLRLVFTFRKSTKMADKTDRDHDIVDMPLMDYYMSIDIEVFGDYEYLKTMARILQIFFKMTIVPCFILHGLFIYTLFKCYRSEKAVNLKFIFVWFRDSLARLYYTALCFGTSGYLPSYLFNFVRFSVTSLSLE